ncbi:putative pentatricopeptide repeat-containing protein, mitochondrial [Sesamum alatum]|uniref:Pentatricopeptide repeat-containing protein, mitochondrial n=1 Tax=Sesamum alatum TaxID=300844 RepID=A0AAE1YDZ5_9LAMI|nr:putative pentatricopeptide repeat-containing protein, mitochondrial [Sesamum alatum]
MRYLFKGGVLNSNACNNVLNSQFLAPGVVQVASLSSVPSKSVQNSKKVDKNSDLNSTRELQGFGPLFNEILGILGTENIASDKNAPYGFLASKETQLRGNMESAESSVCQLQSACENADEKRDHVKTGILVLENNGTGISDEIEVRDVSPIVHKVTEIVRTKSSLLSMEERLRNVDVDYNEEVVEKVLKRCFKVPHLALRFFKWVKFSKGFQHTANTFNTMINIAGEAKEFGLIEELAEEMGKNSCEKNIKTWTVLVSHYGKAKLIGKALLVFEEMKRAGVKPDAIAYRIMLRGLCSAGKADLALEFYKDMVHNEVKLDVASYKQLLKCFALSGDVTSVHLVGENMVRLSEIPEPHTYTLMLKSFCIAGRIKESLELIRDLKNKNIILDTGIFETLVKGLCSRDRIADAMEILEIMKRRDVFNHNIYGILISTHLRRNEVSEACNLFQDAKKSGNISVSTYTNLMQHLFWKNEFEKGLELYNEMLAMGIQLDSVAITAAAAGYLRQNCISEGWKVFKGMDAKGIKPTSKSYSIFIKEMCKVSDTDEIAKVLNEMEACKVNVRDDVVRQVTTYLEKKGDIEKLNKLKQIKRGFTFYPRVGEELNAEECNRLELARESESNQLVQERFSDSSPESAPKFSRNPDIQEVRQILSSSTDWCFVQEKLDELCIQFTPELVGEILRKCNLNISTALKFFSWVGKQTGYSHNEQSYNMAMKIAGQGKNFKQMRSLFYEMRRRGCSITSDTWTIMIMQYGRTGLTDIALRNFREMKLSNCRPAKSTYKFLITSLCGKKGRNVDEAIKIYQEMVRVGCAPDKELVETYVGCLCEAGKLLDARSCFESLHKFGFSIPLSYSLYFRALSRAGKLEDALALMDEIGSERNLLNQYTYGSLIHGLLRRGQLEVALAKMNDMKHLGIHPTVHVYTALIVHFLKEKNINKALETLEEMKEGGCQPTIVTYSALISGYVRLGQVTDAWNVFYHLKQNGPSPDFKTYSMFIDCLCRIGKSEEAFKLISEMLQDGIIPSTINFRNIIYGLNREGKPNLAHVVLKKKLDIKGRRKMV